MKKFEVWYALNPSQMTIRVMKVESDSERSAFRAAKGRIPKGWTIRAVLEAE